MSAADTLTHWGITRAPEVVELATATGLELAVAAAMLMRESGGGVNEWGHDQVATDGIYVMGAPVTREVYLQYREALGLKQIKAQGCGPTQLTSPDLQAAADRAGGCWLWEANIRVGFSHLAGLIRSNGLADGLRAYNGSGPWAIQYRDEMLQAITLWRARLGASNVTPATPVPSPTPRTAMEDEPVNIPIQVGPDGVFRCISNCETGPASALYAAAWVVFNVGYGSQAGVAADIRVAFRNPSGQVMGPDNDHILNGLGNDTRVSLAAPDGCGSVTVEGRVYGGAIPTVERLAKLR